ncbi:Metalloendopeptidase [Aphelenchoides fujianensis]|nr:Metalloendopeptidase [Aphelenchoides fujianensis]
MLVGRRKCSGLGFSSFLLIVVLLNCLDGGQSELHSSAAALTEEDFKNADGLKKDEIYRESIPVEEINKHRPDIRGPYANQRRVKRNGVSRPTKLWPQGRIPYAIRFYHEHERWDRDTFIDIIWQNVDRGALDQFGKVDLSKTSYYGQPYDYRSILHYDSLAFSKNGFPTMLPKKPGFASKIGNAKDFSEIDLRKINSMYKCDQRRPINTVFVPAKAAPIHAPSFYKGYNRPTIDGHYPFFENTKPVPRPAVCEDQITVCFWAQDRCLSPNIYAMMKNLCAKTCRFC